MTLKLSSPWTVLFRQIKAMFKEDADIEVKFDEDKGAINILCKDAVKADALSKILPSERQFGNVTVTINVRVVNNVCLEEGAITTVKDAFNGNGAVSQIVTVTDICGDKLNFVVFEPVVVQYFNDDLYDLHGLCSTLYADIAKKIFINTDEVIYSTDKLS